MKRKLQDQLEQQPRSSRFLEQQPKPSRGPLASDETIIGRTRMCEGINRLFSKSDLTHKTGACVLGIHGMSGIGKSTLAKSLCHHFQHEFSGRVCHLELKSMELLDLQKKVLRDLSLNQDQRILDGIVDAVQAWNALEVGMKEQGKVLLVIDDIQDDQTFVAERFLKMDLAQGSKLLLMTRKMQVLLRVGLPVRCCEIMPSMSEEEARNLFIQAGSCEVKDLRDHANIRKWVSRCSIGVRVQTYHPLALKVLADATTTALGRKPSEWNDGMITNLKFADQCEKQVSEVLRLGYNSLPPAYRPIFVSLVLFAPSKEFVSIKPSASVRSVENVCRWLAIVHSMEENTALTFLQEMKEKNFVEPWHDPSNNLRIHDSYREFAESELQQGQYNPSHLTFKDNKNIPYELKTSPTEKLNHSQRLVLHEISRELRVLKLMNCSELKTVDLGYMTQLRYLVVEACPMLEKIHGLKKLTNLAWMQWDCCNIFLVEVPSARDLQVLRLQGGYQYESKGPQLQDSLICKPPQVDLCTGIRELSLTKFPHLVRAPELSSLISLETLIFNGCTKLKHIPDLTPLSSSLRSLHLSDCAALERIPGLQNSTSLLHLDLSRCYNLKEIPSLSQLKKLKFLDLSATAICEVPGIESLHDLVEVYLNSCENLPRLPNLSASQKLKKIFWRGCQVGRDGVTTSESKNLPFGEEKDDEDEPNSGESDENEANGDEASDENDEDEEEDEDEEGGEGDDDDDSEGRVEEDDELESERDEGADDANSENKESDPEEDEGSAEEQGYGEDEDDADSNDSDADSD